MDERSAHDCERLTHRSAGAWVDLLELTATDHVLLLDAAPSLARTRLAERVQHVGVVSPAPPAQTGALPSADNVEAARLPQLLSRRWQTVIFDGELPTADELARIGSTLTPGGRLVVVMPNPYSPLVGRAVRTASPEALPGARRLRARLRRAGFDVDRWFGLFRSSVVATTAFDLAAPEATQAVLGAALVHLTGRRAAGVRLLRRLPPPARRLLVPGWLIVARPTGVELDHPDQGAGGSAAAQDSSQRSQVVGRMGYERTPDGKVLIGEPPTALERTYARQEAAEAEAMALLALRDAGLIIAPALLGRRGDRTLRIEWVRGRDLPVRTMPDAQLVRWTALAAEVLARIQAATRRPDGAVLVHGDFWLGNVLVVDGRPGWVIDWGAARWGDPSIDQAFLVRGLEGFRPLTEATLRQLEAAVRRSFDDVGGR